MKTLTLIVGFCMVVVLYTQAQKEEAATPDQAQFKKAYAYYENGDFRSAASEFRKFMVEYPESPLVGRAHFNVGYISYRLKDYDLAKMIFEEILTKPYNEQDSNDLMEPYTLYKHHTCRQLAEIALEEKDFEAAEEYIELFDKKFPYQHFCGNEWSAYHMYVAVMRARVYEGTNQPQKAMEELLPHVFSNGLASNERILDQLISLLAKNYSKESIREELNRSLASLEVKKTKDEENVTVMLYGMKVEVYGYYAMEKRAKKSASMEEYYQSVVKGNRLFTTFL